MRQKGFTLVEMLLVLAIIGILVAILLPSVVGITANAKEKEVKGDLRLLQAAIGQYYINFNDFPIEDANWATELRGTTPRIFNKDPQDPFAPSTASDTKYIYKYRAPAVAGELPTYVIYSVGQSASESANITGSDAIEYTTDCIYVTNAKTAAAS